MKALKMICIQFCVTLCLLIPDSMIELNQLYASEKVLEKYKCVEILVCETGISPN